jgi:hypothetical protein
MKKNTLFKEATVIIPACLLASSFPPPTTQFEGRLWRESSTKKRPRSGQNQDYVPLRGYYSIIWIQAFVGMTWFFANGLFGYKIIFNRNSESFHAPGGIYGTGGQVVEVKV